jgi:hypothetical protein
VENASNIKQPAQFQSASTVWNCPGDSVERRMPEGPLLSATEPSSADDAREALRTERRMLALLGLIAGVEVLLLGLWLLS